MGEAKRRKLAGTHPDPGKIEQQVTDGIIMLSLHVEPIPLLHCILPMRKAMQRLDDVTPQLRTTGHRRIAYERAEAGGWGMQH